MANIKSSKKDIKTIEKNTIRNRAVKSRVKTAIKKAKLAIINGDKDASTLVSAAQKEIDKSVSKGIYHKNNGARKSSKLNLLVEKNKK